MDMLELYNLIKEFISSRNTKKEQDFKKYIDDIFNKTEVIVKNYFEMFSEIRINVISGKYKTKDVIDYLLKKRIRGKRH